MKIAVNARYLRKEKMDGIGWFAYNTIKIISQAHPEITFYLFFDSEIDPQFIFGPNIVPIKLFPPAKHAFLNIIWFEFSLKRALNKIKPDLFLSPDGLLCSGWKGKQYGVMHDINFVHIPQDLKWTNRWYYNTFFPKYAKLASRLGTVSEFSKQDIVNVYKIPPSRIDVLYNGINSNFTPISEAEKLAVREKHTGGKPYFVFIGSLSPRKNLARLMEAFDLFKKETGSDMKLVIGGWGMFKVDELMAFRDALPSKDDIIFTGRVATDDINGLLGAAMCMTFVPYFEGFGIPPLESMAVHVPVIASNVTSLPEVTGDAALQVDPYNVEQIKDAMVRIYNDEYLRHDLVEKGKEQLKKFSWQRTADLLWQSVSKCLRDSD